jgi:RNA-directed DNA polymerase
MMTEAHLTLEAVFDAYFDCRRTKRNSINQLRFEADVESNLVALYRDLESGNYRIGRSIAFVVTHPKIREVWAADFRDRVVHHLIYNAIAERFYRRFIRDSYACIPGRGTHDGLRRVSGFARSITRNWTRPAFFVKADVANFFNSIDRGIVVDLAERHVGEDWLRELIRQVALHDPRPGGVMRSPPSLFARVPRHKSLLHAPEGKGLPIGNLTSQFFANLYLNELDQHVKHVLKARHYGRYVDDMILFHEDPGILNSWYVQMDNFLKARLGLHLHPNKKHLNRADSGIDFTGFIIKPGRTYLRRTSLSGCKRKIRAWEREGSPVDHETLEKVSQSLNSYLGMLRQVNGYRARKALCCRVESLFLQADGECTKIRAASRADRPLTRRRGRFGAAHSPTTLTPSSAETRFAMRTAASKSEQSAMQSTPPKRLPFFDGS